MMIVCNQKKKKEWWLSLPLPYYSPNPKWYANHQKSQKSTLPITKKEIYSVAGEKNSKTF